MVLPPCLEPEKDLIPLVRSAPTELGAGENWDAFAAEDFPLPSRPAGRSNSFKSFSRGVESGPHLSRRNAEELGKLTGANARRRG